MEKQVTRVPVKPTLERLKNVAAYARVSSGKDAMLHSLAAQVSYYSQMIREQPGWRFAGVYADEAITGTKDTREEFQRLLADLLSSWAKAERMVSISSPSPLMLWIFCSSK